MEKTNFREGNHFWFLDMKKRLIFRITSYNVCYTKLLRTSLYTSLTAILVAAICGVQFGAAIGLLRFPGRGMVLTLLNTLLALPTVVVGLVLFGLFSRQGPAGSDGGCHAYPRRCRLV